MNLKQKSLLVVLTFLGFSVFLFATIEFVMAKSKAKGAHQRPAQVAVARTNFDANADDNRDWLRLRQRREAFRNTPIVYTWVDGSDRRYREQRSSFCPSPQKRAKCVGGARDRDNGELLYSLRSLEMFAPWLQGPVYIVSPGQRPSWLNSSHARIRFVHQDVLFDELDGKRDSESVLPTFNTNVIEPKLYRLFRQSTANVNVNATLDRLAGRVFVHMNDDFFVGRALEPPHLFGSDGSTMQFYPESGVVVPSASREHWRARGIKVWQASVHHTVATLEQALLGGGGGGSDKRPLRMPYLRHAPYVYSIATCEELARHGVLGAALQRTALSRFRSHVDVVFPFLHHGYSVFANRTAGDAARFIATASAERNFALVQVGNNMQKLLERFDVVRASKPLFFTLNDNNFRSNTIASTMRAFLQERYPLKSSFEL
jgi:Stealth protein CR2, conserved region 2/Stealth protein CR3, conserved region 3